ncbi:hypothetical protein KRMM14A1259_21600 [Krasilnikovia sp. MM14-A1259]
MLMPRTDHQAERPSWDCRTCGRAWPCAAAKVELAEQYQGFPTGLTVYLASCLVEAIDDRAAGTDRAAADLYDRFLGWAKRTTAERSAGCVTP